MTLVHTADQAAVIIGDGCKPSWLKEKARLRQIPFTMLGGGYGWTDAQINEVVEMHEERPAPAPAPSSRSRKPAPASAPDVPQLHRRIPPRLAALTRVPA